jgi:tetratricopeptide (TPR) repeat protein
MKFLIPLIFLAACASTNDKLKVADKASSKVSSESFRKEKPLSNAQVKDFYEVTVKASSPALQDETIDRYTPSEIEKVNSSGDTLLDISLQCLKGDFKGAFQTASQSFNRYQKVAAYWNQVANCHLNTGSFRKALLFYNKALEVSPDYVPALNNIGVMYSRQGQDQKALIAFERAGKLGKFSKTPRYNLARLYLTYGLAESALPVLQSLLNESPNDVDLLNSVGSSYFLLSDYQRAMSYFSKIPQAEWKRAEIGLNVSLTLNKLGKASDAKKVFDMVATPKDAELKRYYSSIGTQLGAAE